MNIYITIGGDDDGSICVVALDIRENVAITVSNNCNILLQFYPHHFTLVFHAYVHFLVYRYQGKGIVMAAGGRGYFSCGMYFKRIHKDD